MLFVLGAGSYLPEGAITDECLTGWGLSRPVTVKAGLQRRSSVDSAYLAQHKNSDVRETLKNLAISCSEMGVRAARIAIERAQIQVDQIGLVLGECLTPIEVTPAEGQRVAGSLGLKVPAYDVGSGTGICPAQLALLASWKPARIPQYVLCVATNAPTQRIDYSRGDEAWRYGDGAVAFVVSVQEPRGLALVWSDFRVDATVADGVEIDTLGYLKGAVNNKDRISQQFQAVVSKLRSDSELSKRLAEVQIHWALEDATLQQELLVSVDMKSAKLVNGMVNGADMLGTSSGFTLADAWGSFSTDSYVAVIVANGGPTYGSAVFRVQKGA